MVALSLVQGHAMIDKDFAQRLARACDDSQIIPPYGKGRQVYIAKRLKVTQEAVRRWFSADSRPRVQIMSKLAALLEVDEAWLSLDDFPGPVHHRCYR